MLKNNLLKSAGVRLPTTTGVKGTGIDLGKLTGGKASGAANKGTGSKGTGGSGSAGKGTGGLSDADRKVLDGYVQQLYSAYRPEKLTYEAADADALREQIAAWLRPSYDSAIAARRDQTAAYRAELDADAIARGMGSSTYVTDVKSRQLADEAEDIATLEGEYGAQLGKLTMEAAEAERERELEVAIENQKQDQAAYMEAYQAALGLFDTYLKSRGGGGGGRGGSAAADVSGTTERNCELFLAGLTGAERYDVYTGTDEQNTRYRNELIASVGYDGYLTLMTRYPFWG